MGYQKHHENIVHQREPGPDKTHVAPTFPASPQMERSPKEYHLDPSDAEEIPASDVPPSSDIAEAKDLPLYIQLEVEDYSKNKSDYTCN